MSEWQTIDSAPTGEQVHLGKWWDAKLTNGLVWITEVNTAFKWEAGSWPWSPKKRVSTFEGRYYSHWKPLPEPPK